jgi:hypothetical protein
MASNLRLGKLALLSTNYSVLNHSLAGALSMQVYPQKASGR